MFADLVALVPSLTVAAAFLAVVVVFLRRQLGPARPQHTDGGGEEMTARDVNDRPCADPAGPAADHGQDAAPGRKV
jgi:hypothetical protein